LSESTTIVQLVRKYWYIGVFVAGYNSLPTRRSRRLYLLSWAATIAGFFTLGQEPTEEFATQPEWWEMFYLTPWNVGLWAIGAWAFVAFLRDARRFRREQRRLAIQALDNDSMGCPDRTGHSPTNPDNKEITQ
jgi:hypothetical protein